MARIAKVIEFKLADGGGTQTFSPAAGKSWVFKEWYVSNKGVAGDLTVVSVKDGADTILTKTLTATDVPGGTTKVLDGPTDSMPIIVPDGCDLEFTEGAGILTGDFIRVFSLGMEVDS